MKKIYKIIIIIKKSFFIIIYKTYIAIFDIDNQKIIKTKLKINNNNLHFNLKILKAR